MAATQLAQELRPRLLPLWEAFISLCLFVTLGILFGTSNQALTLGRGLEVVLWTSLVALVELMPVATWRDLRISMALPLLVASSILYSPVIAALIAFLGSFDPREFQKQVTWLRALFNRSQMSLSVLVIASTYHLVASANSQWYITVAGTIAAVASGYAVNVLMVTVHATLEYRVSPRVVLSRLRIGGVREFLVSYVALGLLGTLLARFYEIPGVGPLSVITVLAPLLFARQMFFRSMALEEAGRELKDRERVLRALSNRMAEERQDERIQIASYLHDDLAQMVFRLTLQVEVAKKRLEQRDLPGVGIDLDGIVETKQHISDMVRALIKDLHRSPIGREGLAEAIRSFAFDTSRGSDVSISTDVVEVSLPPPIQLLIYQIAREAVMNALKHAEPSTVWISLHEIADGVELVIRDDGTGFDSTDASPEGHFGTVMMRERALVAGGTFSINSEPGSGTVVKASFPRVWVEEGSRFESGLGSTGGGAKEVADSKPSEPTQRRQSPPPAEVESRPDSPSRDTKAKAPSPHRPRAIPA